MKRRITGVSAAEVVSVLLVSFLVIVFVVASVAMTEYSYLNNLRENVNQSWSNVQNVYQRRADLVPNLVETVKAAATHEKSTFVEVALARAKVGSVNVGNLATDPKAQAEYMSAQTALAGSLHRLVAVAESYPQLKANENFLNLQNQLEGTENRISVERHKNQETVNAYNKEVNSLFGLLFASAMGFQPAPYFQATTEAQSAPKVNFGSSK